MCLEWNSANWPFQALQNQVIQIQRDNAALKMMFSTTLLSHGSVWRQQTAGEARRA